MQSSANLNLMGAVDETGDGLLFCVFESMVPNVSKPIADNGSLFLKLKKNLVMQI